MLWMQEGDYKIIGPQEALFMKFLMLHIVGWNRRS